MFELKRLTPLVALIDPRWFAQPCFEAIHWSQIVEVFPMF